LGWTRKEVDAGEMGTYTLFQKDGRDVAGMMNPTSQSPLRGGKESRRHTYIAVDAVDDGAQRIPELGREVLVPPHDVPNIGRTCLIADPFGADVILITPVKGE
jgi:predicted enzyme related to lactoylglutathione lyase